MFCDAFFGAHGRGVVPVPLGVAGVVGSGVDVHIAAPEDRVGGDDSCNIVNRLTIGRSNGVQLEQTLEVRTEHWCAIADAVADVYAPKLEELE